MEHTMGSRVLRRIPWLLPRHSCESHSSSSSTTFAFPSNLRHGCRSMSIERHVKTSFATRRVPHGRSVKRPHTTEVPRCSFKERAGHTAARCPPGGDSYVELELQLPQTVRARQQLGRNIFGLPAFPSTRKSDSDCNFTNFSNGIVEAYVYSTRRSDKSTIDWEGPGQSEHGSTKKPVQNRIQSQSQHRFTLDQFREEGQSTFEDRLSRNDTSVQYPGHLAKGSLTEQTYTIALKSKHRIITTLSKTQSRLITTSQRDIEVAQDRRIDLSDQSSKNGSKESLMTSDSSKAAPEIKSDEPAAHHRPLVVGLTKPSTPSNAMASPEAAAAFNKEIEKNVKENTKTAAPADEAGESSQPKQKKEKAPKQPKPPKAAPVTAPTSPALIDLRVGHILRAIAHPNADSLYVSTIAMGDPEGTEHTQVDEETGKVVRTVCSGLNGLVPLAEMQDRKIIVVANLKPVNMRSIKSAAMVLAASPKQEAGADPHAPDRVVELVSPPEGSEAGDKVYFEGWAYGEGKGPEKQLNPKKKQWEAIQPGFYTTDDLKVAFDASKCDEVAGGDKGNLVVAGKGSCTVKTLKDAVVR